MWNIGFQSRNIDLFVFSITMSPENSPHDLSNRKLNCSATSADFMNYGLERNGAELEWESLCLGPTTMRKSKSDTFGLGYFWSPRVTVPWNITSPPTTHTNKVYADGIMWTIPKLIVNNVVIYRTPYPQSIYIFSRRENALFLLHNMHVSPSIICRIEEYCDTNL